MAYIGNTVENQGFTPAIDYFNGDGVTVTFTLSRPIASVAQVIVAIDNVIQNPSSSFTIAGNAITFSSAPLSGTNNIWVEYTSLITTYQAISQDPTVIGDIRATGGYLAEGDFGNSFVAGAILDYVTGLGRITVGSAEGIALYNGGTAARTALMTVAATGNVGIGTTSPLGKLEVRGSGNTALYLHTGNNSGDNSLIYFGDTGSATVGLLAYDHGTNSMTFHTNSAERMRIDSSGQLLVGTTTALAQTTIYKAASGLQSSSPQLTVQNNAADGGSGDGAGINFANTAGAVANIGSSGNGQFFFSSRASTGVGWSERMRIDSSGNVGIGTSSPSVRLQVAGSSIFQDSMQIFNNPTSSAQGILFRNTFNVGGSIFSTGAATTNDFILWVGGSGTQGGITGNGAGVNYSSASDYRLKENVAPMTGALTKVSQLKPCTYIWKFDGSEGQGFIAHELQEVFPDAVTGKKDDVETYTDEDGNEQTKIKPQGVDTSFLVATLTAAIQEQQAMIEELKTKVAALEAR